jgi:hypothetical protein
MYIWKSVVGILLNNQYDAALSSCIYYSLRDYTAESARNM